MSRRTQVRKQILQNFNYGAITLSGRPSQYRSSIEYPLYFAPYNPNIAVTILVWALPPSLAATKGISFDFFSSGYLDGSVPQVLLHAAMYSLHDIRHY